MSLQLIDTHCHLDLPPLNSDLPGLLDRARTAGVTGFVVPGVHPDGWDAIGSVVQEHRGVAAAYGIHPWHADLVDDAVLTRLEEIAAEGVAIGETGLDGVCGVPRELQEQAFRMQIRCAVARDMPLLVHCRSAFGPTLQILQQEQAGRVGGIMHAYSGSLEMAREFIRLGFAISLSATITRPNAVNPLRLARELPLDQLVLETDAPDLPPWRYRTEPNQPAWLMETLQRVAELREMPEEDLARIFRENTLRIVPKLRGHCGES